jgi:hypothetical protein
MPGRGRKTPRKLTSGEIRADNAINRYKARARGQEKEIPGAGEPLRFAVAAAVEAALAADVERLTKVSAISFRAEPSR